MTGIIVSNNNNIPMHRQTGRLPRRVAKQISHESTSSFFTAGTTVSSSTAGTHVQNYPMVRRLPAVLPPSTPEEQDSPKRTVQRFVALRQAGQVEAAAALLDPSVQVSYPGIPYTKTVDDWKRLQQQNNHRNNATLMMVDRDYAWQVLQKGAHAAQVVRRGCVRARPREAVIEVFELHEHGSANTSATEWVIAAMYLRRAPRQWTLFGGLHKKNKQPTKGRLSLSSQRLEREMLQGDSSEQGYHDNNYHHHQYNASSDDYYYGE